MTTTKGLTGPLTHIQNATGRAFALGRGTPRTVPERVLFGECFGEHFPIGNDSGRHATRASSVEGLSETGFWKVQEWNTYRVMEQL